ncbi:MAG: NUDIX domain-containing protein [Spirochaetaceae bacterium]|nr:MAG: NUDIX domain-containing protein [Spirochaetaceae bacterium]
MIVIPSNAGLFNYRIAGIAIHGGRILLHKSPNDEYWALPGGRAEMMERAADTLRRELEEELGVKVKVGGLRWVGECFFEHGGTRYHEIGLYFAMALPDASPLLGQDEFNGDDGRLIFRWHPLDTLSGIRVEPDFVVPALDDDSGAIAHFVIDELS